MYWYYHVLYVETCEMEKKLLVVTVVDWVGKDG